MALDDNARDKLRRITAKYRAERQELIDALQASVDENEELRSGNEELRSGSDQAETLRTQLAEIQGKVKAGDFRKVFDAAAAKAGIKPEMLDDAWELAKLDTKGEQPDPKAIGEHVKSFLKARPHYQSDDQGEGSDDDDNSQGSHEQAREQPAERLNRGAGGARGGAGKGPAGRFVVDRRNLSDMGWMQANQDAYATAVAANNVHYVGKEA